MCQDHLREFLLLPHLGCIILLSLDIPLIPSSFFFFLIFCSAFLVVFNKNSGPRFLVHHNQNQDSILFSRVLFIFDVVCSLCYPFEHIKYSYSKFYLQSPCLFIILCGFLNWSLFFILSGSYILSRISHVLVLRPY